MSVPLRAWALILGASGALGAGACGDASPGGAGLNSLVKVTPEPSGAACRSGGQRIDSGLDENRDGMLADSEIQSSQYVCNPATTDPVVFQRSVWAAGADPIAMNHRSDELVASAPLGNGRLSMRRLSRSAYDAFDFGRSAAEIVDFNPITKQVFSHNTRLATVSYFTLGTDGALTNRGVLNPAVDLPEFPQGKFSLGVNGCAVAENVLAIAVEVFDFAQKVYIDSRIAFYDVSTGGAPTFISTVTTGPQADSVVFSHDGAKILVSGEGEPTMLDRNAGELVAKDPEGSISVISRPAQGWSVVSNIDVFTLGFQDFNDGKARAAERPPELHRIGPADVTWSQQMEPEYAAFAPDDQTAWVMLQEANAVAILDLAASPPAIDKIHHFGFKDGLLPGNEFDASDADGRPRIANWPVFLMYQPDTVRSYTAADGKVYYVTANEGDPRNEDWGWHENVKLSTLDLDPVAFPGKEVWQRDDMLGTLQVTKTAGDANGDGRYENLYAFGGRSFSVWDVQGNLVFDSGNDFERTTARRYGRFFNGLVKEFLPEGNSPWKGPEPEALAVGQISVPKPGAPEGTTENRWFAFIGAEKISGWWIYDITDPRAVELVTYFSNRHPDSDPNTDTEADLSPEGSVFVSAEQSPTGKPLLIAGNEVSGTTSVYEITVSASKEF